MNLYDLEHLARLNSKLPFWKKGYSTWKVFKGFLKDKPEFVNKFYSIQAVQDYLPHDAKKQWQPYVQEMCVNSWIKIPNINSYRNNYNSVTQKWMWYCIKREDYIVSRSLKEIFYQHSFIYLKNIYKYG